MPSPTSSTVPTSRTSSCAPYFSISIWMTEAISSALILMAIGKLGGDEFVQGIAETSRRFVDGLRTHRHEAAGDAAVVKRVADLDDDAAEQLGVQFRDKDHFLLEQGGQPSGNLVAKRIRNGCCGPHFDFDPVLLRIEQLARCLGDGPEGPQPAVAGENLEKIERRG